MIKNILLSTFIFILRSLSGQTDGLLWKISGNGLTKPSYLFGTIHLHCNPKSVNKKVVRKAIKSCDTVAFEIDLGDIPALMAKYNTTKYDSIVYFKLNLSPQEYKTVDSACKVFLNDSLHNLDPTDPQALLVQMMYSKDFIGCNPFPIDFKLLLMTHKIHKPIIGLESMEFQYSLFKSSSKKERLRNLVVFCKDLTKEKKKLQKMLDDYGSHKISAICHDFQDTMIDSSTIMRNLNWLNILKTRMKDKSYFVAVGAGHFCGEQGLIALLRKEGYTLTPIDF